MAVTQTAQACDLVIFLSLIHISYGYFEKHYGLTSLGHFTVNPEIQPGAQRLHEIRTQLVEQKATCVFAGPGFTPEKLLAHLYQGTRDIDIYNPEYAGGQTEARYVRLKARHNGRPGGWIFTDEIIVE